MENGIDLGQENTQSVDQNVPSPDVMLNKSIRQKLDDANAKGKKLDVIYQTKNGIILPIKTISPPFEFEEDANGVHDALVKVWDEQTAGWKSFLIDNILEIEEQ